MEKLMKYCKYCGGIIFSTRRRVFCSNLCMCSNKILTHWNTTRKFIFNLFKRQCSSCGIKLSLRKNKKNVPVAEIHHIVAKKHGGSNEPENLTCLCHKCHKGFTKLLRPNSIDIIVQNMLDEGD